MRALGALFVACLTLLSAVGTAQNWAAPYESGLRLGQEGKWAEARAAFQEAMRLRRDDAQGPILLPGPPTERRQWRGGKPYSPNFLAAYSSYRLALLSADPAQRREGMTAAVGEFEALLGRNQFSREAVYLLGLVYNDLGQADRASDLAQRIAQRGNVAPWRVDNELMRAEELVAAGVGPVPTATERPGQGRPPIGTTTEVSAAELQRDPNIGQAPASPGSAAIPTKFALVVGNSLSQLENGALPFAGSDADQVRQSLISSSGYPQDNVELVQNATAEQLVTTARALAERMPEGATLFLYYTGVGANIGGQDFLAGIDVESPTDSTRMVAKLDLFRLFMARGARIFAFFQVNRPISVGRYFGSEIPMVGAIAQMQATLPGASVNSLVRDGRVVGLFTESLVGVMNELRSNRIPIGEFGWQVFYRMRRGGATGQGGGSTQTPTLPTVTNMSDETAF